MFRRAVSGSAGWVASRIVSQGLEFVAWVLLARRLGASGVGVLAVAAIIARLLGLIGDWGANFRGPRDVAMAGRESALVSSFVRRREQVSGALAVAMGIGLVISGRPELLPMVLVVLARGAGRDWIALGEGRRRAASAPLLVQSVVVCAGVALTSTAGAAALALGLGNALGLAVGLRLNPVPLVHSSARVAVDAWYLVAGVSDQILVSADTVLLVALRSATEAGVYTSIYRLPLGWITVVGLATTAIIPVVTRAVADGRIDRATLHRRADLASVAGAVLLLPAAVLGLVFVGPIFGDDFVAGRDALLVLFVATAATTASAPYRVLYTTLGPDRLVGVVTFVAAGANLVGNLLVIGRWGMQGAAVTTLLCQLGMLVFFVQWSVRSRPGGRVLFQRFDSIADRIEPA